MEKVILERVGFVNFLIWDLLRIILIHMIHTLKHKFITKKENGVDFSYQILNLSIHKYRIVKFVKLLNTFMIYYQRIILNPLIH